MSDTESLDYLQSGFDPSSLTVPRLRSILVAHAIPYPASSKKSQLIEIFNEHLLPKSRKILASRARARRTSKGITDAEGSQESTIAGDEDLMPPPPTPRARSARKTSSKVKVEDSESETSAARSPTKNTPRPSSKHARPSDTETGPDANGVRKLVRKSRKSETPHVKTEEKEDPLPKIDLDSSVFSDDNPFQSGSSPLSGIRSVSGERRRQTLGSTTIKDPNRKKSLSATRKQTESPKVDDSIKPPTSKTFEISVGNLNRPRDTSDGIEPGEEFTPEEQIELVKESSLGRGGVVRRPKNLQGGRVNVTRPLQVIILTLLTGYATWYRQEKFDVGYCGVGRNPRQIIPSEVQLPDWVSILIEPQCEPCPQHAYCYEQLETLCEPDFVLKPHPLSLGGLVPLPPTCEPDGEKVRRIKAVADRAVEELRERRARWECGDLVEEDGAPATAVEIDADELKREVSKKRRKGMTESEFEELWVGAIGEITAREEVQTLTNGYVNSFYYSHKHLSLV
jgi:Man1-Src1p-C-terminal domain/HeH/LEM domain